MKNESSRSDFNKESGTDKPKDQKNYSKKEVIEKIDNMASVAKTAQQKKDMQEIKDQYLKRQEELKQRRYGKRTQNYFMGMKAGLHPRETIERLEAQDKTQDQVTRNRIIEKAKQYYHKHYSLRKQFKDVKNKNKTKDMDKG